MTYSTRGIGVFSFFAATGAPSEGSLDVDAETFSWLTASVDVPAAAAVSLADVAVVASAVAAGAEALLVAAAVVVAPVETSSSSSSSSSDDSPEEQGEVD